MGPFLLTRIFKWRGVEDGQLDEKDLQFMLSLNNRFRPFDQNATSSLNEMKHTEFLYVSSANPVMFLLN